MENIRRKVAQEVYNALDPFTNSKCTSPHKACQRCEAQEICWLAADVRDEAAKIIAAFGEEKKAATHQPDQTEADQRRCLCDALAGTVSKLHTMMEHAIKEESLETVLDISGQIIDCAECIVKLQSGMVDAKMLAELVQC